MTEAVIQQLTQVLQQLLANQQQSPALITPPLPSLPNIECFELSEQRGRKVEDWLDRFNFAVDCSAPNLSDDLKVKLLMTKLGEDAYAEYSKSCLPKKVTEFSFAQTMEQLNGLFGKPQSVWIDRYECLRARKQDDEDFCTFVNRHKRLLRDFDFKKLEEEQFNSLMLLIALKSPSDAALRSRILAKLAADGDKVKYEGIVDDLKMYLSTIAEAKAIEQPSVVRNVLAVKSKPQRKRKNTENSSSGSNSSRKSQWSRSQHNCWRCGIEHSCRRCRHIKTVCRKCNMTGHVERMCAPHQAWLKKNGNGIREEKAANSVRLGGVFLVNSINQKHRLIEIPIEMNGKNVDFVIDSGTESTVLCEEAHRRIGSPRVSRCNERAKYPDGSTRTFLGKGLATFSIGGRTQTGRFFVSKKGSKNLLGTEMMEKLGLMDPIRRSLAGKLPADNVQGAKERHYQSAVRDGVIKKKPSDKHLRMTKRFALGATVIASQSNSQSGRAGYVSNRTGTRQDGVSLRKAPSENIAGEKADDGHGQRERLESDRPLLLVSDLNPLA
uniref:CCHC-type domain-containing protein n=1 Tax=Globodera rostochiensis TaxID=31243 RepID=A0A914HQE5_GLORO